MQVDNLRQTDVTKLEKTITGLQKENPDIKYRVFDMEREKTAELSGDKLQKEGNYVRVQEEPVKPVQQQLDEMTEMICTLQATLAEIFGDHVLIKGRWQNLTDLDKDVG